ncbi:MAG: hypothetical protein ABH951_02435 [Patescibacteria group bacterium]
MGFFFPNIAYASVDSFILNLNKFIINPLIVLLFAVALMFFLFGVFEFFSNGESEDKKTKGKSHMIWGIVGLTIMMGVWFILGVIMDTFNITGIDPEKGTVQLDNL